MSTIRKTKSKLRYREPSPAKRRYLKWRLRRMAREAKGFADFFSSLAKSI